MRINYIVLVKFRQQIIYYELDALINYLGIIPVGQCANFAEGQINNHVNSFQFNFRVN